MSTVPPIFSMFVRTTSMPTPRPENCVTRSAVEKPGQEDQVDQLAVGHAGGLLGRDQLGPDGLVADALRVDAAAVVGDLDDDLAALVEGVQEQPALGRLAPRDAARPAARCRGRRRCGPCA